MEKYKNNEIEEIIDRFKDNIETEKYLVENLGLRPCFVLKKNEKGSVFSEVHHHDLYEILYIVSGKILYLIDGHHFELNAGELILIPPTSLHKLDKFITEKTERIVFTFSHNFAKSFSSKNTDLLKIFQMSKEKQFYVIKFNSHNKKLFEDYLDIMDKLQFSEEYGADAAFNIKFIQTMLFLNDIALNTKNEIQVSHNNKIVEEILNYINENLERKILIQDISNHLSLSVSRISHIFKEETGISILQFINKKRLMLSKELIRKGEHISTVYNMCGYQDNTSFFRAFKKEYGITPKNYYKNFKLSQ